MSWHFTLDKIGKRIGDVKNAIVRERQTIGPFRMAFEPGPNCTSIAFDDASWSLISVGGGYTAREKTVILRTTFAVPETWAGRRVYLGLELPYTADTNPDVTETLVYLDGVAVQAVDRFHRELVLEEEATPGHSYALALEAYSGLGDNYHARNLVPTKVTLKTAELQWIDRDTESLFYDMQFALDAVKTMDLNSREYTTIVNALDHVTNLLDYRLGPKSDAFYVSIAAARQYLQNNLFAKYHADPDFTPTLWSTGHAHIDTAWLWRLSHTRKKVGRTFTTALALMDQYPDYRFSCSQPQHYAALKQDYPEVYERVKQAVKNGKWETVGGMWIESDCNVVSGESLVRQFLFGQRFFEREFGTHNDVVWLPDVFGYSAAFPQIIKKAGMKYFMTIKIHWSQINKPPYQTFEWEGIDGTSVLTHYSPLGDYNAQMTPEQLRKNWNEYKQKNLNDSALYIYGNGDGGGGPTRGMLEVAARAKDFPGMPRVKLSTGEAFFQDLERQVTGNPMLPRWVGELYLEYHRGTYTSQAHNKQSNRRAEFLLQAAEQISALALLLVNHAYPQDAINHAWELTLLNQFHDIIPGSSIREVYEDSDKDYAQILDSASDVTNTSLQAIASQVEARAGDVVLYNPLSWNRFDVAELPAEFKLPGQHITDLDGTSKTLVALADLPSLGYDTLLSEPLPLADNAHVEPSLHVSDRTLENAFFKLTLETNGEIASLWDKRANREVIDQNAAIKGNALLTFEDKPMKYDAWDIDIFYQDKVTPVQILSGIAVVETGPIRASIEVTRHFGIGSHVRQRISLYRDLPRIDFDTEVDWQERQTLLKAAFPVNVRSLRATYDIQFGNVERPTHWNTSWDWARFEVCGQKWADLSEGDYGVSLLSDSKYGWDIRGNVMRLTLLKGAISPDPEADLGRHHFKYALYPHQGDWRTAQTVRRAYEFNIPVQSAQATGQGTLPNRFSLISVEPSNVILETVKRAEDSHDLIVRLYEAYGQRGLGTLTFARSVQSAVEVNLMEVETDETKAQSMAVSGQSVAFNFGPYEIKTFLVRLAD